MAPIRGHSGLWLFRNNEATNLGVSPITLIIDYTVTQFDFKFRLPSTKTVTINWGDGTSEVVVGQDSTTITETSAYSGAGTFLFYLTGDVIDITYIDIRNMSMASGDISTWSALINLTVLWLTNTGLTGRVDGLAALVLLTSLRLNLTSLSGDASGFSALIALNSTLYLNNSDIDFNSSPAWNISNVTINIQDCGLTSLQVDNVIKSLSTCTGCTINASGTNASRTSASIDDLITLYLNGNTITLTESLGPELHTDANAASDPNGNEADATTGWSQVGLDVGANIFQSQGAEKDTGGFAFQCDANDTPTAGASARKSFSVEADEQYKITGGWRHIGSGANWAIAIEGNTDNAITSADTTWRDFVIYFEAGDLSASFWFRELGANNGGVYYDNVSFKKVL